MKSDEMKVSEVRRGKRLPYEKPAAVDMGAVATVLGASCTPGGTLTVGDCTIGNSASVSCGVGNSF